MPEPGAGEQGLWNDLRPLLDQELKRLPDKYRVVIVLCDLGGKTRKEAARQLGCPEGTVAGRLARARTMLAKRLARHGLAVSGGALAAVLAQDVASASPPTSVVSATTKAATAFEAGRAAATGVISVEVAALTEGVLKAMFMSKIKVATAVLVLAVALGGACGAVPVAPAALASGRAEDERGGTPKKAGGPTETFDGGGNVGPKANGGQRILRWRIVFNTKDGKDYAEQLEALGAVLAIPTGERDRYRVIRDLSKRPVRPTVEDVSKIHRIFWVESNNTSVRLLSKELGLKRPPDHIVVSLPKFIEDELFRKEFAFSRRPEEDIEETTFQFFRSKRGFDIKVTYQRTHR
jgi:hypothetical protein